MLTAVTAIGHSGAETRCDVRSLLSPELKDRVRADANSWIKQLRLVPYGGTPMRERFTYRGDSLWWFTEIYLHKMRRLEEALATIFALQTAVTLAAPARLVVTCSSRTSAAAARAFSETRGIPLSVIDGSRSAPRVDAGLLVGISAVLSRLRLSKPPAARHARVAAFVHTAFWREGAGQDGREGYIGDVLDAVAARVSPDDLSLIGVGPRRTFRARRWWNVVVTAPEPRITPIEALTTRGDLRDALVLWRRRHALAADITTGDAVRLAGRWGAYDLWPVLSAELADAARVQWPWSARAMDEARAALRVIEPDVAVTYAEAGGWGRALVLEARRVGVPTVGLQHGFIYRHWLNYQHEPDEMSPMTNDSGFPRPTRTLVFDRWAADTLTTTGRFPPDAIAITGSPRLDQLLARFREGRLDTAAVRRELGLPQDGRLLVLAAKASEIGPHLEALFAAVHARPGVRLLIKPHPAETRDAYLRAGPRAAIEVLDAHADLGRLLAVADVLVTMNSTVALDALVLGVPSLVIGLPNNLSPFVEAGVMTGTPADGIGPALDSLLYDREARAALLERGRVFAGVHRMEADGGAADRAADAILATAAPRV